MLRLKKHNRPALLVAVILIVALLMRIVAGLLFPQPAPDTERYDRIASGLISGKGFSHDGLQPAIDSPPLYPLFLAGVYKLFGHSFLPVRITQAVIDTATCLLVYLLAMLLFNERKTALISLVFATFYPTLIAATTFILTETLYTFLLIASVLLMVYSMAKESPLYYAFSGFLLGLAGLCRPIALLFPFFLIFFLLLIRNWDKVKGSIAILLIMAATISPWTIRNYIAFNRFLPVSIGIGGNLWLGSYIPWDADYRYKDLTEKKEIEAGLSPIEADDRLKEEALKNIKENPGGYLRLCVKKFWRFWFLIPGRKEVLRGKMPLRVVVHGTYLAILFLFVIGLCNLRKYRNILFLPPLLMIFYFTVFHTLLFAIPRYRIPIMPLVLVIASLGFSQILAWRRRLEDLRVKPSG